MVEIWKEVTDFEGLYEVSNYGNVRSVDRMVNHNKGLQSLKGKPKNHHCQQVAISK